MVRFIIFISLISSFDLYSQTKNPYSKAESVNNFDKFSAITIGGRFLTSPPPTKGLEGSSYLFEEGMKGELSISFLDSVVEVKYVNYNILTNYFDIFVQGVYSSVSGDVVKGFSVFNIISGEKINYVKCSQYDYKESKLTGYCTSLYDNEISLVERKVVNIKPATYNNALMIGDNFDKIQVNSRYYYKANNELYDLKSKKDIKALYSLYVKSSSNPKKWMKTAVKRTELIQFFDYLYSN